MLSSRSFSPSPRGTPSPRCYRRCSGRSCRPSACRWCRSPCHSKSFHRPVGTRTPACCPLRIPSPPRSPGSWTWWSCGGASDWCLQYKSLVTILSGKKWPSGSVALWPHLLLYREEVAGTTGSAALLVSHYLQTQHDWYIPLTGQDYRAERRTTHNNLSPLSWAKLLRNPRKFYQSNPTIWNCPITMKNHTFLLSNSTAWEII